LFDYVAKSNDDEQLVFVVSEAVILNYNSFLYLVVSLCIFSYCLAHHSRLVPWPMERLKRNTQMITYRVSCYFFEIKIMLVVRTTYLVLRGHSDTIKSVLFFFCLDLLRITDRC
jgi:TRAP-type mannitol/chloroaromatic compound transport system permease small subunit